MGNHGKILSRKTTKFNLHLKDHSNYYVVRGKSRSRRLVKQLLQQNRQEMIEAAGLGC